MAKKNSNTMGDIFFSPYKSLSFFMCAHALCRKLLHFQNTSEHSRAYNDFFVSGKYHLGNHKTAKVSRTCFTSYDQELRGILPTHARLLFTSSKVDKPQKFTKVCSEYLYNGYKHPMEGLHCGFTDINDH